MEVDDPRALQARDAAGAGRWQAAAALWEELAADLVGSDAGAAVQALSLAADAWRREDRPVAAARALRRALVTVADGPGRTLLTVQLASVLSDAGQLQVALDLAQNAVEAVDSAGVRTLAADLACGLAVELGRLPLAGEMLERVEDPRARSFRAAVLHRVVGRLARASAELSVAFDVVGARPELAGLRAALHHEEGEMALLVAQPADALEAFLEARALWGVVRRRAGLFLAIAGEVRTRVALGEVPLTAELDRGLVYATDRGLLLLEQDLLVARAHARAAAGQAGVRADLDRAVELAAAMGAGLREGRARKARVELGCGTGDDADAARALLAGTCWR